MPEASPWLDRLKNSWLIVTVVVAFLVISILFRGQGPVSSRSILIGLLAAAVLTISGQKMLPRGEDAKDPLSIRYVVAFDAVLFIVVGLVPTLHACGQWQIGLLLAGSGLLIGGFFGLLFGYPQGVAQQTADKAKVVQAAPAKVGEAGPDKSQTVLAPQPAKNLLAQAAATLGTAFAGFTLARIDGAGAHFRAFCDGVGPALITLGGDGLQNASAASTLAGAVTIYFLAVGFFSGLLLPTYFMKDQI